MSMESVSRRRESINKAKRRSEAHSSSTRTVEHIVALYPGTARKILLRIYGPRGHVVAVKEHEFPYTVADIEITPREAQAPYSSEITIAAHHDATPGVYAWRLQLADKFANEVLGEESVTLIILPRGVPLETSRYAVKLEKVYKRYGIQLALWTALKLLYPNGASFSRVKALYELLTSRRVSKGTVGNTLARMLRKKILERTADGLYKPVEMSPEVLRSRIDLRRVRFPWQVLRLKTRGVKDTGTRSLPEMSSLANLPAPIYRAYERALRIAEKHGPLAGLYFLLHTLMGTRQTGYLLLWYNGWFINCERKTSFCHHYYSWLLHHMLESIGLGEGIYYPNTREHKEARRTAQRYIREYYGSHQAARRLHYLLRERGYIETDDEIYTIRIHHYPLSGDVGVEILDAKGNEILYTEGLRDELSRVETRTSLPYQHVDEDNEETYFHRPGGLF